MVECPREIAGEVTMTMSSTMGRTPSRTAVEQIHDLHDYFHKT